MCFLAGWLSLMPFAAAQTDDAKVEKIDKMYRSYQKLGFAKVPDIPPESLDSLVDPVLVDVRPLEERQVSMLPGAIPLETYEADPSAYTDRPVVVYCTIGARSGLAAKKLQRDGITVLNLKGSILSWTHNGGALVDADGNPTTRVHTYGRKWDLVAEGYTAVY